MSSVKPFIIFDWDGTLMDSIPRIVSCMQKMAADARLPVPTEQATRDIIGLSLPVALEVLFDCYDKAEQTALIDIYRHYYIDADTTPSPMFDGATELLQRLHKQGFPLAVATGKARPGLLRVWEETGTERYFVNSRCASEAPSKPNPAMLKDLMAEQGADIQDTLMIGDSKHDLRMANNAGIKSLGVTFGVHDAHTLNAESPFGLCHTFDDVESTIHDWIESVNSSRQRAQALL
ncbi:MULTISPECIES: HAD family hydrolase [Gammaproteobacteria]|uniref:HAD family hydrolase n=1 Tax=Gammaproteobacteria TaxID=1236 RepID=UPI000DD09310|nr:MULTISPECIES: HAD-IA family hydrolase [Gammaproteobacteria]RTE87286.1 HAD family hydrolase [Aliidiomarina sp. B3213]TCZ92928.1 HAD family hydrolase [Lysobacter sp. N42]